MNLSRSHAPFADNEWQAIDRLGAWIVRRGMTTPALFFFETVRPFNRVGAAAMTFLHPWVDAMAGTATYVALRDALDHRESIELLMQRIEHHDSEMRS